MEGMVYCCIKLHHSWLVNLVVLLKAITSSFYRKNTELIFLSQRTESACKFSTNINACK